MHTFLLRFFLLIFSVALFAQQGDYYLKHVQPQLPNIDNDNYTLAYDHLNRLYIGNRQGLIQYDGKTWNLIENTPGTVFSLHFDSTQKVMYVGCMNAAGLLVTDEKGKTSFKAISDSKNPVRNVSKILRTNDYVYFVGENLLLEYSRTEKKITKNYKEAISSAFLVKNELHIQKPDLSIWKWNKGTLVNAALSKFNEIVLFSIALEQGDLIGTDQSNIYNIINGQLTRVALQDSIHLRQGQLADGLLLAKNSLLLSTVKGGCLLLNPYSGRTHALFHLFSGLPDNEVYAIGKDLSGGAWIAHEYGLSRLDAYLPYRCFSNYIGLTGHINNVQSFNNQLYVGTNEGIFLLAPHLYSTSIISSNKLPKNPGADIKRNTNELIAEKTRQQRTRSFFKIFKRKDREETKTEADSENSTITTRTPTTVRKDVSVNTSSIVSKISSFEFQKLEAPELKCEQLLPYDGKLWAGTNRGLFLIQNNKAVSISDENIRYIYGSRDSKTMYASTTDGNVLAFSKNERGTWEKLKLFDLVKQPISGISEDDAGNLWLAGIDKLYRVKISNKNIEDLEELEVSNPFSDNIMLIRNSGKLYIYLSGQFFFYENGKLIPDPTMDDKYASHDQLIYKQSDIVWLAERNRWKAIGEAVANKPNLNYISLFPSIRSLFYDNIKNQIWIITKDDELYNLDLNKAVVLTHRPIVVLSSIQDEKNTALSTDKIFLNYDANNLNFYFSSPDYYNQDHLEYQYKIDGLNDTWSNWSKDNSVFLRFLNPGNYQLSVKVRNTFGQEALLNPIEFKIRPPYWQTWWFYLLEVIIFAGLWFLTVQLSRKKLGNQLFIKLLTLLTLVMTVEFMSTVAENLINIKISPVIDFLVKVLIAITLLPIEKLLARVIRNKE